MTAARVRFAEKTRFAGPSQGRYLADNSGLSRLACGDLRHARPAIAATSM